MRLVNFVIAVFQVTCIQYVLCQCISTDLDKTRMYYLPKPATPCAGPKPLATLNCAPPSPCFPSKTPALPVPLPVTLPSLPVATPLACPPALSLPPAKPCAAPIPLSPPPRADPQPPKAIPPPPCACPLSCLVVPDCDTLPLLPNPKIPCKVPSPEALLPPPCSSPPLLDIPQLPSLSSIIAPFVPTPTPGCSLAPRYSKKVPPPFL